MRPARSIASAEAGYGPSPGPHRQSVDAWWEAARSAIAELRSHRVDAIALSGTMENLIAVDEAGRPVHDVILYSDPCGAAALESLAPTLMAHRAGQILGNPPEPLMTAFKLHWLQTHEPSRFKLARWFLPGAKDALALRLTGRAATDPVTATTTGLMDLRRRDWSPALLAVFGSPGREASCDSPGRRHGRICHAPRPPPISASIRRRPSPSSTAAATAAPPRSAPAAATKAT